MDKMTVYIYVYESDGYTHVDEGIQVFAEDIVTGWKISSSSSSYWTTLITTTPPGVYDIYAITSTTKRVTETKRVTYQGESMFQVKLAVLSPPLPPEELELHWFLPVIVGILFSSAYLI